MLARFTAILAALGVAACTGSGDSADAATARAPTRSGEVWEIDATPDRATTPAALLAYVHGLHVVLLDRSQVYAGMSRLAAGRGPDGSRVLSLGDGLEASIVPAGEGFELRFSSGEHIPLVKREGTP